MSRAVAIPIADPTIEPTDISGELKAIPRAKQAPVSAFSWKKTCPIPRKTASTGSGILRPHDESVL